MNEEYYDICLIPYTSKQGEMELPVKLYKGNLWMSQKDMAILFEKSNKTISEHLKNIYKEEEIELKETMRVFKIKARDGKFYNVEHYSIESVIALAYRVHSEQAKLFRVWATNIVSKHIIEAFTKNAKK